MATTSPSAPRKAAGGWVTLPTGSRVYYERAGGRRTGDDPVLLLHGIAHSSRAWATTIPALARTHDVIALDLPGCGLSDKPRTDYSLGAQAAAVRYVLDALKVRRVTVVGHSLGGGVGMTFAYTYPERVGRMALVSSGGLGKEIHPLFRLATLPLAPEWVMRAAFAPSFRLPRNLVVTGLANTGRSPFYYKGGDHYDEIAELLLPMEDPAAQRAFLGMLRSASNVAGQAISALDRIGSAACPALVIWGREDAVFPVAHARQAARLVPGCRLEVFPRCGHFPQLEAPGRFIAVLTDWLATTSPARQGVALRARV